MTQSIVILGAGYAGLMMAHQLARKTRGLDVRITVVSDSAVFADRIRQHEHAARAVPQRSIADALSSSDVDFVLARATRIDTAAKQVVARGQAGQIVLSYDRLVYALGSMTDTQVVPGIREHAHAFSLKTAETLRVALPALVTRGAQLVVAGGGLSGIEATAEFAEAYPGLRVTLVTRGALGAGMSARAQRYLRAAFVRLGVTVREHTTVQRIDARMLQTDHGALPFDECLWTGPFAVPALARESGLPVNALGQLLVDDHFRSTADAHVYAIGDAARLSDPAHAHVRMACATASAMAPHAASEIDADLRGRPYKPFRMAYVARNVSLGRRDGVIDMVTADDTPRNIVLTGRLAALYKNSIGALVWRLVSGRMLFASAQPRRRVAAPDAAAIL